MSDLKERFPRSPELHTPQSAVAEPEGDPEPQPSPEDALLDEYPGLREVQKRPVTSFNAGELRKVVEEMRVKHFRDEVGKGGTDLTPEETDFLAEVLALKIRRTGSVKELLTHAHQDAARDLPLLLTDVKDIRRMKASSGKLETRFPTMPNEAEVMTPEGFVSRGTA